MKKKEDLGFDPHLAELLDNLFKILTEGNYSAFICVCDNEKEISRRMCVTDRKTASPIPFGPDFAIANALHGDEEADQGARACLYNGLLAYLYGNPDEALEFAKMFTEIIINQQGEEEEQETPPVIPVTMKLNPNGDC